MSDEELRQAERELDPRSLSKHVRRASVDAVRASHARLDSLRLQVLECIAAIDAVAPKCWCGEVGEPLCAEHAASLETYESAVRTWRSLKIFERWVHGDEVAPSDLKRFAKLWAEAGMPGAAAKYRDGDCMFPECSGRSTYWTHYCPVHRNWRLPSVPKDKSRRRQ